MLELPRSLAEPPARLRKSATRLPGGQALITPRVTLH
jgi:hypothetical protein